MCALCHFFFHLNQPRGKIPSNKHGCDVGVMDVEVVPDENSLYSGFSKGLGGGRGRLG